MNNTKRKLVFKEAMIGGVSTFFIDGIIQYFMLKGKAPIPISVDAITNTQHTVLGSSVFLAIILSILITVINYVKIKEKKVAFFPKVLGLIIRHGFFTFGAVTALSVVWQRYMGTIEVGHLTAVFLIASIAGTVSATINYLTIKRCVLPDDETNEVLKYIEQQQNPKTKINKV